MSTDDRYLLLIEDSDEDFEAICRSFAKIEPSLGVKQCSDGDEALKWLGDRATSGKPLPDVILLDLNLPGVTGIQVLESIRSHLLLESIPVIILTTSNNRKDIGQCYSLGASGFVQKPVEIEQLTRSLTALKDFWLDTCLLPKG